MLEEFYQMSVAHDYVIKGGVEYARKVLINAFGPDQARKMFDRLMKTLGNEDAQLRRAAKDRSAAARQVHSQRASADHRADSFASESVAGGGLAVVAAGGDCAADVALRMASLDQISPEIISKIATVIGTKLKIAGRAEPRSVRRRSRGRGNVQSPGFQHRPRKFWKTSSKRIPRWAKPSGT